jgi:CelD/BcsL family acetyltransferase involved in cellulose biosynthesis
MSSAPTQQTSRTERSAQMSTSVDGRVQASRLAALPELEALRDEWRRLEKHCPDLTPFSTWEWCHTAAMYYGGDRPLWLFTFRDGGDLVGIAPFAETRLGGLRLLRFIGSGLSSYAIADYQDILAVEGREDEIIAVFCDELALQPPWDVLHLQELPSSSRTVDRLVAGTQSRGWLTQLKPGSDIHLIPIDGTWDSYKAKLSKRMRRLTRTAAERAAAFITVSDDDGAVHAAMQELFDLHTRRWGSVGMPGIFGTEQKRDFYHEVAARFAHRGMLRISLLRCEDQTVAISLGFLHGGVQYLYITGFDPDPEWARFRFGLVLSLETMKDAFERGVRCVDWMRGAHLYKDRLLTEEHFNQDLLVFRNRRVRLHYRFACQFARVAGGGYERLRRKLATKGKHSAKAHSLRQDSRLQ